MCIANWQLIQLVTAIAHSPLKMVTAQ